MQNILHDCLSSGITIDWVAYVQWKLISRRSGGWESESRVPVWPGSGERPLPGLQRADFSLHPHVAE